VSQFDPACRRAAFFAPFPAVWLSSLARFGTPRRANFFVVEPFRSVPAKPHRLCFLFPSATATATRIDRVFASAAN